MATNGSTTVSTTSTTSSSPPEPALKPFHLQMADNEKKYKRNPHPNFKALEATRPPFNAGSKVTFHQTPSPDWKLGQGVNGLGMRNDANSSINGNGHNSNGNKEETQNGKKEEEETHVEINPYAHGRATTSNYKLLISCIAPRPIAFVSTTSPCGTHANLAPFSFFNVISSDPPLFALSITGSLEPSRQKDTLRNLIETRECVINIISESFLEAANATAINAPYGVSEWTLSGLTPAPSSTVQPPRVNEAVFAVEATLESVREFESRVTPGKKTSVLLILEGRRFWVRGDAFVGGPEGEKERVDPDVLRPVSRFGGISYGRTTEIVELERWDWQRDVEGGGGEARRVAGLEK